MYKIKPTVERSYSQLTRSERAEIARRTQAGEKQVKLAIEFRCDARSISRACKAAGVTRWLTLTPELEKEAVRLMRQGLQQEKVARRLRLSGTTVHELYAKYRIDPYRAGKLAPKKLAKIVEAVRAGKKYCNAIARAQGVATRTVLKYAHLIRGGGRFIPGNRVEPLQSLQNSEAAVEAGYQKFLETAFRRTVSAEASTMHYEKIWQQIVQGYLEREYAGVLPPDRAAFLSEIVSLAFPECWPESWPDILPLKSEVVAYLKLAVDSIASKQNVVH
jgi:hypothetical protein